MASKFVNFMKAHVVGPVVTAASAAGAAAFVNGSFDIKAAGLAFLGALLGAVLHKEVVIKAIGSGEESDKVS